MYRQRMAYTMPSALRLHHLKSRIELVAAGRAANTIGVHDKSVVPDSHPSAVRAAREVQPLIVHRFIARPAEAVDQIAIEHPGPPLIVHDGKHEIVTFDVLFGLAPAR